MTAVPVPTGRRQLRLHVDWTACQGRGHCIELLPELFTADPWGYPVSRDLRDPAVPPELLEHAGRAAASCPRLALRLMEG